eukprot:jgi/Galph1/3899/GphlegSOOS_G2572.1
MKLVTSWKRLVQFSSTLCFLRGFSNGKYCCVNVSQEFQRPFLERNAVFYSFGLKNPTRCYYYSKVTGYRGLHGFDGGSDDILLQRERIFRNEAIATVPLICVEVDAQGNITSKQLQKTELASSLRLNYRDLRVVDPSFRNESPVFLARKNAVIVHLEHIRAIVQANSVLIFDPANPAVQNLLPQLRSRIKDRSHPLPFEFRSLEAFLIDVCTLLSRELRTLVPALENVLDTLSTNEAGTDTVRRCLDRLLPLQNSLNDFEVKIREVHSALNDVLRSDEDMSEMYLTTKLETGEQLQVFLNCILIVILKGHRRRTDQHEELEMMFETYLKQIDSIRNEVASTLHTVRATENITQIRLDAMRNRILRLEIYLNIGMLSLSTGAFCSGLFGMNLTSHMEDHPYAFYLVSASLIGFSSLAFATAVAWVRFKKIFQ